MCVRLDVYRHLPASSASFESTHTFACNLENKALPKINKVTGIILQKCYQYSVGII